MRKIAKKNVPEGGLEAYSFGTGLVFSHGIAARKYTRPFQVPRRKPNYWLA
ncbi:MAG: hypothetical protein WCP09_01620 [Candidatus Taylorbacteria bacterium]